MLIKFQSPDPRAGTTVRMDSNRGQYFVDIGSAVALKEDGTEPTAKKTTPTPADQPAPLASEGLTVAQIKEALEAKNVAIPDGVTLKADLAALLDAQPAA